MKFYYVLIAIVLVACSVDSDNSPNPDNNGSNNGNNDQVVSLATVSIEEISGITSNSAISGGSISSDGGGSITNKGIVWATSSGPDLNDNSTNDGSNSGSFVSTMVDLENGETYYVRAYATNEAGTAYSQELIFDTFLIDCSGIYNDMPVVRLNSQADVNAFGSQNYCGIDGILEIVNTGDITDLSPLASLQYVQGLRVYDCDNLSSLEGLDNLRGSIPDYVRIEFNDNLVDLSALSQITSVGSLTINGNPSLASLAGLESIQGVVGDLSVIGNDLLPNINELSSITSVDGELRLVANELLVDISGLQNISRINNGLSISIMPLTNLEGFSSLEFVGGFFRVHNNQSLLSLDGLNNLVEADVAIFGVYFNRELTNIQGLESLTKVTGGMQISQLEITHVDGLSQLTEVGGIIDISQNELLINLDGLENLQSVGEDLLIRTNTALSDFCGIRPLLISNGLQGDLVIVSNPYNPTEEDIIAGQCSL